MKDSFGSLNSASAAGCLPRRFGSAPPIAHAFDPHPERSMAVTSVAGRERPPRRVRIGSGLPFSARARNPSPDLAPMSCTSIGAGTPKFKIWLTISAGWKKNCVLGNSAVNFSLRSAMYAGVVVLCSGFSPIRYFCIRASDRSIVAVRHVQRAVRKPDVVHDISEFAGRYFAPDKLVHLVAQARRLFDAQSSPASHVQPDQSRIHAREKILPEHPRERR